MYFFGIREKQFALMKHNSDLVEHWFPPTVTGAIAVNHKMLELMSQGHHINSSSDLNHPDEFPEFEEHAIDIAAGYYEGAVAAGIITVIPAP